MTTFCFEVGQEYESNALSTAKIVHRFDSGKLLVVYPLCDTSRTINANGVCEADDDFTIYLVGKRP